MRSSTEVARISSSTARSIRLRVSAVAPGCSQTVSRSATKSEQSLLVLAGQGIRLDGRGGGQPLFLPLAISDSRSFHLRSSSAATSRFCGSTASYWRRPS